MTDATPQRPNLELSRMLRDLEPGDETQLHRIATLLAAGEVVTVMDTARFAARIDPDTFEGMRQTAQAVRVAVAYGDLTGLQGCGYSVAK
jgi:hypothetical protein